MILRYLAIPIGIGAAFLLLWLMWPSPIDPVSWDEPPAPELAAPIAPNDALRAAMVERIDMPGAARGVAVSTDGMVYFGTPAGDIMRLRTSISRGATRPELVAHIVDDGIFGLSWIDESTLGIAAAGGLYSLHLTSLAVETLSTGASTRAFGNIANLAIAPDGRIFFTDSSRRWDQSSPRPGYYYDMLENRPNGTVYVWDPESGRTAPVRDRLYFPNGIAMASDGQSIFVTETFRYRIQRIWIAGPRAGEMDIFAKNLPGLPAGIANDGDGHLVVAMLTRRSSLLALVHRRPGLTRVLIKLPQWLRPNDSTPLSFILRLNESDGRFRDAFHDPDSTLHYLSTVTVGPEGEIWFGSAFGGLVGRYDPPEPADLPEDR